MAFSEGYGIGSLKPGVCTSSTRPGSPYVGQIIYETDTTLAKVWNGSAWVDTPPGKADLSYVNTQDATKLTASTAVTSGRNLLINGGMTINQRGRANYAGYEYSLDRWITYMGAGVQTVKQQNSNFGSVSGLCARIQRNSSATSTNTIYLKQAVESINSYRLQGKTATLSFYARKGANFSEVNSQIGVELGTSTGYDQDMIGAWAGSSPAVNSAATLTTTWTRYTFTGTIPSNATQVGVGFWYNPSGTAGANDYFEITGVQLEEGSVATPFEQEDYGITLLKCSRYCQLLSIPINAYSGFYSQNGNFYGQTVSLISEMRTAPSAGIASVDGGAWYWVHVGIAAYSANSTAAVSLATTRTSYAIAQSRQAGGATPTAGQIYYLECAATLLFRSEL